MKKRILVALAVIFLPVLLLGCGEGSSSSGPGTTSVSIVGTDVVSGDTGTVEGRTWYTDPNRHTDPNQNITKGVHIIFSAGGREYSTDSKEWGWYSIELPSSSEPGISYTIHATLSGCQPYEGEVTVVTGTSIMKDIVMVLTR